MGATYLVVIIFSSMAVGYSISELINYFRNR